MFTKSKEYIGCEISYENKKDIQQKLENFSNPGNSKQDL